MLLTTYPLISSYTHNGVDTLRCVSIVLLNQHATGVRRTVTCLAVPYFPTLFHKLYDLREKVFEHQMCFDFL